LPDSSQPITAPPCILLHVALKLRGIGESEVGERPHSMAEEKARCQLVEIATQHLAGVRFAIHTAAASRSALAKAAVQVAAEVTPDLVVPRTHSRKGLPHLFLGSVAEEIIRTARAAC
jgi:nucleotide-binding universal stress UspA family protein